MISKLPSGVERVEADPAGLAARPPDPVVVATGDGRPEVQVVRVLGHDLDGLVARADQRRVGGIAVFETTLERPPQQAGQHPVALGDVERVVDAGSQHVLARRLEGVAELRPDLSRHDPGYRVLIHRVLRSDERR
jgi:hypothetical protein